MNQAAHFLLETNHRKRYSSGRSAYFPDVTTVYPQVKIEMQIIRLRVEKDWNFEKNTTAKNRNKPIVT